MAVSCGHCGRSLSPGAKFCGGCGSKAASVAASEPGPVAGVSPTEAGATAAGGVEAQGVVSWGFLPGEVARRIANEELVEITKGGAKAFLVSEGQRALIYVDGLLAAEMGAGRHEFLPEQDVRKLEAAYARRTGGVVGMLDGVGTAIRQFIFGNSRKEQDEARQGTYDSMRQRLGKARSISVVLVRSAPFLTKHVLSNVRTKDLTADVALTMRVTLGDTKSVYAALLADRSLVRQSDIEGLLFGGDDGRSGYLAEFVADLSRYTMDDLTNSPDVRRALSVRLHELSPEFLRVLQLTSLSASREDLNRVRQEREANVVAEQEMENLVATNRLCNRFQIETNRRAIEEARNGEELAAALQSVNSDGLLREEQLAVLLRDIEERAEDHQLNRAQVLRMLQSQQEFDYQKARLQYEEEITNRQLAIEREREANEAAHRLKLERERADFEHHEDMRDLDVLRKMQAVKDEQAQREHDRVVQAQAQGNTHQQEMTRLFAGMTAEQILVANPNLSPAQAAAMAEIAKAKTEVAQKDDRVELVQAMMGQFMQTVTGALGAVNQAKEAELKRTLESTDKAEDRMMRVVNTTVTSMKKTGDKTETPQSSGRTTQKTGPMCSQCNAQMVPGSKFCVECGTEC
jgi:hypothetical protein